jgi:tight adherence protein C
MELSIIFGLCFAAVFLTAAVILSWPLSSRAKVKQSLDRLAVYEASGNTVETEEDSTLMDQVVEPILSRIGHLARHWTDEERLERIRHKLTLAGIRHLDAEKFVSTKLGLAAAVFLTYLLVIMPWLIMTGRGLWLGLPLIALAFYLPDLWLKNKIDKRQHAIAVALPDTVDIITIGIEAGLAFNSAVIKVVKNMNSPLSEELGRLLTEMQVGVPRRQAVQNLSERTTVPELRKICATIIQADTLGVSIGKILRNEAEEVRVRRRQAAEEEALKTPVKMVFPIVLFILPALLMVIVGPGVIRIAQALF